MYMFKKCIIFLISYLILYSFYGTIIYVLDMHLPLWRNWQTHRTQNPAIAISYRFDPDQRHSKTFIRLFFYLLLSFNLSIFLYIIIYLSPHYLYNNLLFNLISYHLYNNLFYINLLSLIQTLIIYFFYINHLYFILYIV